MWIPQTGTPIESALASLKAKAVQLAKANVSQPILDYAEIRDLPLEEREGPRNRLRLLDKNCDHWAGVLLYEMVRRSQSPILFAINVSGARVALPAAIIARKEFAFKLSEMVKAPEVDPNFRQLRGINVLRFFQWAVWADAALEHEIFSKHDARRLGDYRHGPEIESGVLSLSSLERWLKYSSALVDALRFCPDPEGLPLAWRHANIRDTRDAPRTATMLHAFQPLEGWRVIIDGALDPQIYIAQADNAPELDPPEEGEQEEERPSKGRKKSVSEPVKKAIILEIERLIDAGEIPLDLKRQAIYAIAREYAEKLGIQIGDTTAREILLPILDKISR